MLSANRSTEPRRKESSSTEQEYPEPIKLLHFLGLRSAISSKIIIECILTE
jgi:hypothetical protein